MLTQEENERLCRVGPGTPMGDLMRRYWHPIAGSSELEVESTRRVRVLGEDLALYRDRQGRPGLLGLHCPHRKASLEYGIPEEEGLRCCYHGWLYDREGRCLEQPAESPSSTFKDKIQHTAYPVEELGGLIFAYLGPKPAPLLPRYDVFVWEDAWRDVGTAEVPCNWLQCMENSVDVTHVDYLHGLFYDWAMTRLGRPPRLKSERAFGGARHVRMDFELFPHGIVKHRLVEGAGEDSAAWQEGTNPLVFPNMTRAGGRGSLQIRVPVDDTHTLCFMYSCYRPNDGHPVPSQDSVPIYRVPLVADDGKYRVDWITGQDMMAWATQGPVMDRTDEKLGASDQGIIFFRQVLFDQLEAIERGEDPLGVIRDPAQNAIILLKGQEEGSRVGFMDNHWQQFSPIYKEARALLTRSRERGQPVEAETTRS